MIRRVLAAALLVSALGGCHEDPSVLTVNVTPVVQAFAIDATGGAAANGQGGAGGDFTVTVNGGISLGSPGSPPTAPLVPPAPLSGFAPPSLAAAQTFSGNVQLGTLTTSNANTSVTSSSGDIVVFGVLQSFDNGAQGVNITLNAPNGTVYVKGGIRTSVADGILDGRAGGSLTINAFRIVITGSIDTTGEENATAVVGDGGAGGAVTLTAAQQLYFTAGWIDSSGGARNDTAVQAGLKGGNGGAVTLAAGAALELFGSIRSAGGAANGNGATPAGGDAGAVTLSGVGVIDCSSAITMSGGDATGAATGAAGGKGADFKLDGSANAKLFGAIDASGGSADATGGVPLTGGAGGKFLIGQTTRPSSLEVGQGLYGLNGGAGGIDGGTNAGGNGGAAAIETRDGLITIGSSFSTIGGAGNYLGTLAGNATPGVGGGITIRTDFAGTNLSTHVLSIPSFGSRLELSGGAATGDLNGSAGGAAGALTLQANSNLTCGAKVVMNGGAATLGNGGAAGNLTLKVDGAGPTPNGSLSMSGNISARGGATTGANGGAGSVMLVSVVQGPGSLSSTATIDGSGADGSGLAGNGGAAGTFTMSTLGGDLSLAGSVTVSGGSGPGTPASGGTITVGAGASGGSIISSTTFYANGGSGISVTPANNAVGGTGGSITISAPHGSGSVLLLPGTWLSVNGGTGIGTGNGGAGGPMAVNTSHQAISLAGSYYGLGGSAIGTGTGGTGGTFTALSNTAAGRGGDITLQGNSGIDVSAGSGALGGSGAAIAVVFDADGANTDDPLSNGIVSNLGQITTVGASLNGSGGGVRFDGLNETTLLVGPLPGTQNLVGSGTGTAGVFTSQ